MVHTYIYIIYLCICTYVILYIYIEYYYNVGRAWTKSSLSTMRVASKRDRVQVGLDTLCTYPLISKFCLVNSGVTSWRRLKLYKLHVCLCVMMWCDVMWCDVMWCDVMWCDVMWCDVMWCEWCDVMWCDVMWCDVMFFCNVRTDFGCLCMEKENISPAVSTLSHPSHAVKRMVRTPAQWYVCRRPLALQCQCTRESKWIIMIIRIINLYPHYIPMINKFLSLLWWWLLYIHMWDIVYIVNKC